MIWGILRSMSICLIKTGIGTKRNSSKDKNTMTSVCLYVYYCVCFCLNTRYCVHELRSHLNFKSSFPPITISVGKRDIYDLQLEWTAEDMPLLTWVHTHTNNFFFPFLWFLLPKNTMFSSSLIQDNWSLSEILKPVTLASHCCRSNSLQSCPSHYFQPHPIVFFPSLHTSTLKTLLNAESR